MPLLDDEPVLRIGADETAIAAGIADLRAGRRMVMLAATGDAASAALVAAPIHAPEERRRAERYRRPIDAFRHLLGRGLARRIAGGFLDLALPRIAFVGGRNEKPRLREGGLDLSISHSGEWVACAVSPRGRIGVDVEEVEPGRTVGVADLAPAVLDAAERAFLEALPESAREAAFLDFWRRKEAISKATGHGLSIDPRSLCLLAPEGGFAAHVAADGVLWRVAELSGEGAAPVAVAWEES